MLVRNVFKLLSQVFFIARIEAGFLVRFRRFAVATATVACIPALYAMIYLSSVWDPPAHTHTLGVALVNLDQGVSFHAQDVNVGNEVVAKLKSLQAFGYHDFASEDAARLSVRQGKLAFALVIPRDFSSNAVPGARSGGGRLLVYTSEGNNYQGAFLARRFATDLGNAVNASLNERRWASVLSGINGSRNGLERLHRGVHQLHEGARKLSAGAAQTAVGAQSLNEGASRLSNGVVRLIDGFSQLGDGLKVMDTARPAETDLARFRSGAVELASGHQALERGLAELQSGTRRLRDGVVGFRNEIADSILIPARVTEGLDQVADGISQLDGGLHTASDAQHQLSDGSSRLGVAAISLTQGIQALGDGVHTAVVKLPEAQTLNSLRDGAGEVLSGTAALADGNRKVTVGAQSLRDGIKFLERSLPGSVSAMEGSAEGLASSVQPQIEVEAPVQNHGSGFAPNVLPAALWLGAGIIAFLFNVRVMPREAQHFPPLVQLAGKLLVPAVLVTAQAGLVLFAVAIVLKIHVVHIEALILSLGVSALTFLAVVFALTRALGDAGKALAMLFLAVQLTSSGGVLPVELSGGVFAQISPWLPMTWVVQAIKASMFGAYDSQWQQPLLQVACAGFAAMLMANFIGRWRYVGHTEVRPPIEF